MTQRALLDLVTRDGLLTLLRSTTVFFTDTSGRPSLLGSGVIARMCDRTIIFTVGHVVREVGKAIGKQSAFVSLNSGRGAMQLGVDTQCFSSPGDHTGIDAGVVLLPQGLGTSLDQFAGYQAARASTLRPMLFAASQLPSEYIVCGFPEVGVETSVTTEPNQVTMRVTPLVAVLPLN